MRDQTKTVDKPSPLKRTDKNIARITQELLAIGFANEEPEQRRVFNLILNGRLNGYNTDNCPHPHYIQDGQFMLCTQCGYYYQT